MIPLVAVFWQGTARNTAELSWVIFLDTQTSKWSEPRWCLLSSCKTWWNYIFPVGNFFTDLYQKNTVASVERSWWNTFTFHFTEIWRCFFLVHLSGGTSQGGSAASMHWCFGEGCIESSAKTAGIVPWDDPHGLMGHVQKPRHRKCMTQRVDWWADRKKTTLQFQANVVFGGLIFAQRSGKTKKKQHLQRLNRENFQVVRKAMAELGSFEHGHYTMNIGNVSLPEN